MGLSKYLKSFGRASAIAGLALACGAGPAAAQSGSAYVFPRIHVWAFPGAYQDSSLVSPRRCVGSFKGPLPDSIREQPRTVTVRFLRDRRAEARPDFGGYRIYRVVNAPDTTRMTLIRRFSRNFLSEITWHFSVLDTSSMQYFCNSAVVHDSIVTFVDADSNGQFQKVCRRLDQLGRCISIGDSIIKLVAPPGPHDGFLTWYSITYEKKNTTDNDFEDLFVPDTSGNYARCGTVGNPNTCPNLNDKSLNLIASPVEPTAGPTVDLERVSVVPNPYRESEAWDAPSEHEVHFINLPPNATIKIYTLYGDLVTTIEHTDPVRDFERWDLRNGNGRDVASGIYVYRVESSLFRFQNRFVVIR